MNLSNRVHAIKESPTIAVTDKARRLREAGHNVIGLGAGEPDFDTADFVLEAAKAAMDAGQTRYTAVDGTPEIKEAIIAKMKRDHDLEYRPSQVVVSSGGKNSLYNLVQAVIDAGDEAIVPAPYWVSYTDIVLLAGGVPVVVETDAASGFKMSPEQLEAAITPRTRLLVLNSPSNPTGACYRRSELAALAEVLRRHPDVVVATDDMYEKIMWDDEPFSNILMAAPDLVDRTVVLNGVSKAYAMTGWRIGYAAGPDPIAAAMRKIQSQCTSNPCSVSQAAAAAAISGDHAYVEERSRVFQERGDYVNRRLNELRGVACVPGRGAFYAFPDFERPSPRITTRTTTSPTRNGSSRSPGWPSSPAPPSALPASCASPSRRAWRTSRPPSTASERRWARSRHAPRRGRHRSDGPPAGIDPGRRAPLRSRAFLGSSAGRAGGC